MQANRPGNTSGRRIGQHFARIGLPAHAFGPLLNTLGRKFDGCLSQVTPTRGYYWMNASWGVSSFNATFSYGPGDRRPPDRGGRHDQEPLQRQRRRRILLRQRADGLAHRRDFVQGHVRLDVTDHVRCLLDSSPNHEGFAFFYCNRNEEERRKPLSVLRSYVRQLSTAVRNPGHMRKQLQDLCRDAKLKGSDLGFELCKQQLLELMNCYPKTILVLDALDECEPESRWRLVEMIEDLMSKSNRLLKVFISSRPDGDIRELFTSRPNIEIQATDNQEDIEKFVNGEIVRHHRWNKISPSLWEEIVRTLLRRSSGM